jgi:hypothetical protein
MKLSRIIFFLICLIVLPATYTGCSAEKQVAQRRNLMMPEKTDLPRNSKYSGSKKKKTYKPSKNKQKKRR